MPEHLPRTWRTGHQMETYTDTLLSGHPSEYSPQLLRPIPRGEARRRLGIADTLPFSGEDIWNAYELSWLDPNGKPVVATGEFRFPADSPHIVESKSLKFYLNSLNAYRFDSPETVRRTVADDLGRVCGAGVRVWLRPLDSGNPLGQNEPSGQCIDSADLPAPSYDLDPQLLLHGADQRTEVAESLYSNLLKTNCPVTGQPDWATILIRYRGPRIRRRKLLAYLVSYRNHAEFHEQCVERMFVDLKRYCRPRSLTVYARYLRRGGLDINPFRSDFETTIPNIRLPRQ